MCLLLLNLEKIGSEAGLTLWTILELFEAIIQSFQQWFLDFFERHAESFILVVFLATNKTVFFQI